MPKDNEAQATSKNSPARKLLPISAMLYLLGENQALCRYVYLQVLSVSQGSVILSQQNLFVEIKAIDTFKISHKVYYQNISYEF